MFGFLIKKNFCDGWDNLLSIVLTNFVFLFAGLGLIYLNLLVGKISPLLFILTFILSCVIVSILVFAYGDLAADIADFKGIRILDYFKNIPSVLKDASLFGLMVAGIIIISLMCLNFYFIENQSIISFLIGSVIFWIDIFVFLSLQWFVPIRSLMHNNFKKCLKKSFIIFLDNTAFSIAVAFYNLILVIFTIAFIGFLPSFSGILISSTNALRLRLYKYDYLEEHPELTSRRERKSIPWEELIYDDRETLGPRKLRSFLFPWKED